MNTWVLCLSRRKAFEWTMRSRSRWNGVRSGESGSETTLRAGYERVASGESHACSQAWVRSWKCSAEGAAVAMARFSQSGRRKLRPPRHRQGESGQSCEIFACAAATRAIGTRYGEQLT